jgi:hypothetical protein
MYFFARTAALLTCTTLGGCKPASTYVAEVTIRPAELVDSTTQTYRFADGRCRSMLNIPPPWRVSTDVADQPIMDVHILLEANSPAFGVPEQYNYTTRGKNPWPIRINVGTVGSVPEPGGRDLDGLWGVLQGTETLGPPTKSRWPLSPGLQVHPHPFRGGQVIYLDKERRIALLGYADEVRESVPISGVAWTGDQQSIGLRLPPAALERLDVISAHFPTLPDSLIAPCKADDSVHDATPRASKLEESK